MKSLISNLNQKRMNIKRGILGRLWLPGDTCCDSRCFWFFWCFLCSSWWSDPKTSHVYTGVYRNHNGTKLRFNAGLWRGFGSSFSSPFQSLPGHRVWWPARRFVVSVHLLPARPGVLVLGTSCTSVHWVLASTWWRRPFSFTQLHPP